MESIRISPKNRRLNIEDMSIAAESRQLKFAYHSDSVFRFRSLKSHFNHDEVGSGSIYFAQPSSLNDPNEGLVNFFWKGDSVIWENFVKNYVFSLTLCWEELVFVKRGGEAFKEVDVQSYQLNWANETKAVRDNAWRSLYSDTLTHNLINVLWRRYERKCSEELIVLFKSFHGLAIKAILEAAEELKVIQPTNNSHEFKHLYEASSRVLSTKSLFSFQEAVQFYQNKHTASKTEAVLNLFPSDHIRLLHEGSEGDMFFANGFPRAFVNSLDSLFFDDWYVACFSKDYHNSSMWGQYADGHSGYCLEFKLEPQNSSNDICKLELKNEQVAEDLTMFSVQYCGIGEVDFFASLPVLDDAKAYDFWLKSGVNNISSSATHYGNVLAWIEQFYERSYGRFLSKTSDWKHEGECRLIIQDRDKSFRNEKDRVMKYSSDSLASITFGIKTPEDVKFEIISRVNASCSDGLQPSTDYYQAYYSPENMKIQRYKIPSQS
jgi:hypothetical protein